MILNDKKQVKVNLSIIFEEGGGGGGCSSDIYRGGHVPAPPPPIAAYEPITCTCCDTANISVISIALFKARIMSICEQAHNIWTPISKHELCPKLSPFTL